MISVDIVQENGWQCHSTAGGTLWFKGYLYNSSIEALAKRVLAVDGTNDINAYLQTLDGHFAFVAQTEQDTIAAVDRVRSIPLLYAKNPTTGQWHIDDQGKRLAGRLSFGVKDINSHGALSIAMSGYSIERDTLYRDLCQLAPGDFVVFGNTAKDDVPQLGRYYIYAPWRGLAPDAPSTINELAAVTLTVFEKLVKSADGRQIAIPLSAGMDSRLVLSALSHLKYPNLKSFSYGRSGNFEAKTAELIAKRLGVPWRFVPVTHKAQKATFATQEHRKYLDFADSCTAVPFKQDFLAIKTLKENGWLNDDAIIVNGNSGDFITGGHIAKDIASMPSDMSLAQREHCIIQALLAKHYSLWDCLKTLDNEAVVGKRLHQELVHVGAAAADATLDYGVYEYSEFNNRQCKYVINGQRIYEFFGHDWRLPLWDNAYLDFWERVPLEAKINQRLYREMLETQNWGGVWQDIPVNKKTIRPLWVLPFRFIAKVFHAPLGSQRWHRFERRFFQYWMDNLYGYAPYGYCQIARSNRGARNAISWYTGSYLNDHGLAFDGTVLTKRRP